MLSPEERSRYSRHLLLPQVGEEGQLRLQDASVLVVGAGGLGAPLLMYLAAAGIGRISIVDDDVVSASNLHRQVLFHTDDVGKSKVDLAAARLRELNPNVVVDIHRERFTADNAMALAQGHDVMADGSDNFATRYLVNDVSVLTGIPNVYASIFRFDGQVSVFGAPDGPCYRCLFPEPPPAGTVPSCAEGGVLGVLPGLVGSFQATEVIKWVLGIGDPLVGRLLMVDALTMDIRILQVPRDPSCPVCGDEPSIRELQDYEAFCSTDPPNHPQDTESMFFGPRVPEISVMQLKQKQEAGDTFFLLDVRHPEELAIADLGGTCIPMEELPTRLPDAAPDKDADIVVMCRSGSRSAHVVAWMQQQGYTNVHNLAGGIIAWSRNIDPDMPVY